MNPCRMDYNTLLDYQEGRLDAATTERVRRHLQEGCTQCRRTLARLERLLSVLPEVDRLHAPASAIDRARVIYQECYHAPERQPLMARLVFDSRTNLAFAGARCDESDAFQRLYVTDMHTIDLWEEKADANLWYLVGQVLLRGGRETVTLKGATLTPPYGAPLTATLETEEFHIHVIPAGVYQLLLHLSEDEIVVPDVVVGA
jgi:hypothetical protein